MKDWPTQQRWKTVGGLLERVGEGMEEEERLNHPPSRPPTHRVQHLIRTASSSFIHPLTHLGFSLHGGGLSFSIQGYHTYAQQQTDDLPLYIFDSRFVEKEGGLGEDYLPFLPPYFAQVGGWVVGRWRRSRRFERVAGCGRWVGGGGGRRRKESFHPPTYPTPSFQ